MFFIFSLQGAGQSNPPCEQSLFHHLNVKVSLFNLNRNSQGCEVVRELQHKVRAIELSQELVIIRNVFSFAFNICLFLHLVLLVNHRASDGFPSVTLFS